MKPENGPTNGGPGGGPGGPPQAQPLAEFVRYMSEDRMPLHALLWSPPEGSKTVAIYVPGMGGGFVCPNDYNPVAAAMIQSGYAFMAINTRSVMPPGIMFAMFEDCVPDLAAAVEYVKSRGFTDIVLIGDSLGGPRTAYYWVERKDPSVKAIVFLGAIKSPYLEAQLRWNEEEQAAYDAFLENARQAVAEGRGRELRSYPWFKEMPPVMFSAQTFVNLFGSPEDSKANTMKYAPEITVPVLVMHGKRDSRSLPKNSEDIYDALTAASRKDFVLVDSDHFFVSPPEAMAVGGAMVKWLKEIVPAA